MTLKEEDDVALSQLSNPDQEEAKNKDQGHHITRGISSLTIQNLATSALGFVFLAVLLRLLPNIDYGIYSALSVTVGIAAVIAPMGLSLIHI